MSGRYSAGLVSRVARVLSLGLLGALAAIACGGGEVSGDDAADGADPPPPPGTAPPAGTKDEADGGPLSGADHDPCDGERACRRYVFVTSTSVAGNFAEGLRSPIARARDLCDEAATRSPILRGRSFEPWLSIDDPDESAREQVLEGTLPYLLLDGAVIADSFAELASGQLKHPIDRTEANEAIAAKVWTGSTPGGGPGGPNCTDWRATTGEGRVGDTTKQDGSWSFSTTLGCAGQAHLYCIEF